MGCCQKFLTKTSSSRSVICLKWVLPLRLIVLLSLAAHLVIYLFLITEKVALLTFFVIIHFFIALSLLQECRRSVDFHKKITTHTKPRSH